MTKKTKAQLVNENKVLQRRVAELETRLAGQSFKANTTQDLVFPLDEIITRAFDAVIIVNANQQIIYCTLLFVRI